MATRVSQEAGLSNLSQQLLIKKLRSKAGKREGLSNFIGLQRSLALADVEDPGKSLNNVLDKVSLLDSAERNLYGGPYNALDWNVTKEFANEGINREFLRRLSGASIGGGSLGSTVSTTPRIRIEDRVSLLNSFYGEGSFPGLHSGPDAQFYRGLSPQEIGLIRFTFNESTGVVTVLELRNIDDSDDLTPAEILSDSGLVVLELSEYLRPQSQDPIFLTGVEVSLRLESPGTWSVQPGNATSNLLSIRDIVGSSEFGQLRFKLTRPYSVFNPPLWYTESPQDSSESVSGSADDNNPFTSSKVLEFVNGEILPRVQKGYWFSRAYVETRWSNAERSLIGQNNVTEDSNLRWQEPPSQLRGETFNWGIRWDGYLRITPGIYAFEIQTNVSVRIDMDIDGWTDVFNTSTAAEVSENFYISSQTFDTDSLDNKYKFFTGDDPATDWVGYAPISIRLFYGGPDRSLPEFVVPEEPNMFIKTTSLSAPRTWYSDQFSVTLSGTDGDWDVTGTRISDIISIIQDSSASVTYRLTAKGNDIFAAPVVIVLTTNGTTISSSTTGLESGIYTLAISPVPGAGFDANKEALWKARVASPSPTYRIYDDLTESGYVPDVQRIAFDPRAQWWKTSEGNPFNRGESPSSSNTPLDGFITNEFKDILKSDAPGVGLYGDGETPPTFSSVPNLILGESVYEESQPLGTNYIGIELNPNSLGEGGQLILNALPVNNSVYNDSTLLGENDLGGNPNHLTVAAGKPTARVIRLYLWDNETQPSASEYNKYFTVPDLLDVSASDDPEIYGFPPFSSNDWISPIDITAVRVADDDEMSVEVKNFVAPLNIGVEKVTVGSFDLIAFTVTLGSLLDGGSEVSLFSSKYIEYFTESDVDFQYERVDTGESLSFSNVLKLTYDGSDNLDFLSSEVPKPASERVTPWGYDKPEFSSGICYPPYATGNPLLEETAIEDSDLYSSPIGNYDVFWGNPLSTNLGDKSLTVSEKIEFSGDYAAIEELSSPTPVPSSSYSHRLKIEVPLEQGTVPEDALEYVGNGEKVKDFYYAYVLLDS